MENQEQQLKILDDILKSFKVMVLKDEPVSPAQWIEGVFKVNALKGSLDNKMIESEMRVNEEKANLVLEDYSDAKAETLVKKGQNYLNYKLLKAKQDRVIEFIRLVKARGKIEEF